MTDDVSRNESAHTEAKDIAENLRTVHLSLLVVCLALSVVVFSPAPYVVRKANQDLQDIANSVSAARWSRSWLLDAANEKAKTEAICKWPPATGPSGVEILGQLFAMNVSGPQWAIDLPQETLNYREFVLVPPTYGIFAPENLAAFKRDWDAHPVLFCPLQLALQFWMSDKGEFKALPLRIGNPPKSAKTLSLLLRPNWTYKQLSVLGYPSEGFSFVQISNNGSRLILLPVESGASIEFDARATLIREIRREGWHDADFKDAFRELDQMTTGFQDLDFSHLQKILHLQEKNSKEGLEAFGVKFPVETTTRWGVLLVIAIQLYFWLHIREYRRLETAGAPVAWIGFYTQATARIAVATTALLMPPLVVGLAVLAVPLSETPATNLVLAILSIVVSIACAALGCYEYFKTKVSS